ncbi:CesT family type III secretion system chaperone [Chlamydia psittaci]|uniref:CesT family type III secretion system chaperone n=1 Tax=Chlamydia psittaci TaxID=83554 RepID=UPI00027E208C|nr:CesT family type III secretion system chaperone [Chlamydia psittaci]EPJ24933.1 tir chaperone family protein [Chlamydia psittaci 09DC77]EPJ29809.1 tir chaperone family protein [Chlamydia psittaci 09DC78]EPL01151.1 tir chaperone family protein [Chlamydia psittaci 09DC79]AFS21238.1 tir chaperone family protein [Chlamydia psittaci MN]AFS26934.1 tir chaperone family protein [Chlamydia psittaci CP3]
MQNQFEQLLESLGTKLNTSLVPDKNHACLIRFSATQVPVQLEEDSTLGNIAVGTILGTLPENVFRERIFKAALSVNASPQSNIKGILGYGEISQQLYLSDVLNMNYLNGEKLFHYLNLFSMHAKIWIAALETGNLPDLHVLGMYHL